MSVFIPDHYYCQTKERMRSNCQPGNTIAKVIRKHGTADENHLKTHHGKLVNNLRFEYNLHSSIARSRCNSDPALELNSSLNILHLNTCIQMVQLVLPVSEQVVG